MVSHQTIGKQFHSPTVVDFANRVNKGFVVRLVEKDSLSGAATIHHVIDGSGILNSKRPRHDDRHYYSNARTVNKRFDPPTPRPNATSSASIFSGSSTRLLPTRIRYPRLIFWPRNSPTTWNRRWSSSRKSRRNLVSHKQGELAMNLDKLRRRKKRNPTSHQAATINAQNLLRRV